MRLIDADALTSRLKTIFCSRCKEIFGCICCTAYDYFEEIDDAPTIEPVWQEWISVQDRTPTMSCYYLVYVSGKYRPSIKIAYWMSNRWIRADSHSTLTGITHWMPLPKPPMEVSE